jgi:hypothetical protein
MLDQSTGASVFKGILMSDEDIYFVQIVESSPHEARSLFMK